MVCAGDHDDFPGYRPFGFQKRLRKRRMYICPIEWCDGMGFFKASHYRDHLKEHQELDDIAVPGPAGKSNAASKGGA
jgi:hypothetical protein